MTSRRGHWDERYASDEYHYGTEPNAFLVAESHRIAPGAHVLAVADGEGRNGVWLAGLGANVHSIDGSLVAVAKARRLAESRGVSLEIEHADVFQWDWPVAAYDAVVAIFVQFVDPQDRPAFFRNMQAALKPGGVLLLEGYGIGQLAYGTGGPRDAPQLYTAELLRDAFADMQIEVLRAYDAVVEEGPAHSGLSALVDLVAVKR
jgi:cyclopropane fatty-acyl-phospholipid synthase-like methyltransferase